MVANALSKTTRSRTCLVLCLVVVAGLVLSITVFIFVTGMYAPDQPFRGREAQAVIGMIWGKLEDAMTQGKGDGWDDFCLSRSTSLMPLGDIAPKMGSAMLIFTTAPPDQSTICHNHALISPVDDFCYRPVIVAVASECYFGKRPVFAMQATRDGNVGITAAYYEDADISWMFMRPISVLSKNELDNEHQFRIRQRLTFPFSSADIVRLFKQ